MEFWEKGKVRRSSLICGCCLKHVRLHEIVKRTAQVWCNSTWHQHIVAVKSPHEVVQPLCSSSLGWLNWDALKTAALYTFSFFFWLDNPLLYVSYVGDVHMYILNSHIHVYGHPKSKHAIWTHIYRCNRIQETKTRRRSSPCTIAECFSQNASKKSIQLLVHAALFQLPEGSVAPPKVLMSIRLRMGSRWCSLQKALYSVAM